MIKARLDKALVERGLASSRSQAENYIKLGVVSVNNKIIQKAGTTVVDDDVLSVNLSSRYVSRAGLKLDSVAKALGVDFADKIVLDVGSSTGGFTDYALQNRAKKVFAVDVGTDQLHPKLRGDERVELHEKTDIRDFRLDDQNRPDAIVIDVSFISLRDILPHIAKYLSGPNTKIIAMLKPQFEAGKGQANKGVIKNDTVRRKILKDFELWSSRYFVVLGKRDSDVAGAKGNLERFYLLQLLKV